MATRLLARLTGRDRRRLYLHIGAMKTGTTYLQQVMEANQDALLDQGVLFPGRTWNDQHLGVREILFDAADAEVQAKTRGRWEALVTEIHEHDGRAVVLSMEYLSYVETARAQRVLDHFQDFDVHVVLGVRDAERTLPAQWHTAVANGSRLTLPKLVQGARHVMRGEHSPTGRGSHLFQRTQGIPRMLEVWTPLVGAGNVHVVTVPPSGSDPDLLWQRFAEVVDVRPESAPPPAVVANPSLGHTSTELIRRINAQLGSVPPVDHWKIVRDGLGYRFLRERAGREPAIRLHRPGVTVARSWNAVVRRAVQDHGVDVTGDLDDLPTGPVEDAVPTSLFSPSDEDLLEVAEDAFAGLLEIRAELSQEAGAATPPVTPHRDWGASADPVAGAVDELTRLIHECIALRGSATDVDRPER